MARRPNYNFERSERDRLKALKVAEKSNAKRAQRELAQPGAPAADDAPKTET
jgi:hypothetical protein